MECRLKEKKDQQRSTNEETVNSEDGGGEGSSFIPAIDQSSTNYDTSAGADSLTEDLATERDPITINVEMIPSPTASKQPENDDDEPITLRFGIGSPSGQHFRISSSRPSSVPATPSRNANPNDSLNQSVYFTPTSHPNSPDSNPTSLSLSGGPLVRSDSYTIEKPSAIFVEHMQKNGVSIDPDSSNVETSEKTITESDTLVSESIEQADTRSIGNVSITTDKSFDSPANKSGDRMEKLATNMSSYSFDESSSNVNDSPKYKADTLRTPNKAVHSPRSRLRSPAGTSIGSPPRTIPPVEYNRILKLIEEQHASQVNELLWRQQEERKRMQLEFHLQQDELMRKISDLVESNGNGPNSTEDSTSDTDVNGNLDFCDDVEIFDTNRNTQKATAEQKRSSRRLDFVDPRAVEYAKRREVEGKAATKINAHARGYLTRRLFRTNKVKDLVKTIRDILLFLLDMHSQRSEDETPADIELKVQLLQQVISQFILFRTSLHIQLSLSSFFI